MCSESEVYERARLRARRLKSGWFVTREGVQLGMLLNLANHSLDDIERVSRNYQNHAYVLRLVRNVASALEQIEQLALALELKQ